MRHISNKITKKTKMLDVETEKAKGLDYMISLQT